MTDEDNENDELSKAADFYSGISDVRETSRVTHRAMYTDMLVALMERVMELEKLVSSQEDALDKLSENLAAAERRQNLFIVGFWVLLAAVTGFFIATLSLQK